MKKEIKEIECQKCGWLWKPLVKKPRVCPRCKSYKWEKIEYLTEHPKYIPPLVKALTPKIK